MNRLIRQWHIMLTALAFLTRLPVPKTLPYSPELLNRANRYFGFIGLFLGALAAGIFTLSSLLWSHDIAIVLTLISTLLLTGVFHEDGLADTADGLGGGLDVQAKLHIMKDSRIGSYGSAALIMAQLLKFAALAQVQWVILALLVGHSLSRTLAASLIGAMPYVRDEGGKSKPLASLQTSRDRIVLFMIALLILAILPLKLAVLVVAVLVLLRWLLRHWLLCQLGGFTGDALGACQQIAEVVIYLLFALPIATHWLEAAYG